MRAVAISDVGLSLVFAPAGVLVRFARASAPNQSPSAGCDGPRLGPEICRRIGGVVAGERSNVAGGKRFATEDAK